MRFKGWFGRKRIGYGVGPRSWEGWLATAVFAAALIGSVRWFRPPLLGLYLLLVWATYDPDI
jgi:hypothetical protein